MSEEQKPAGKSEAEAPDVLKQVRQRAYSS